MSLETISRRESEKLQPLACHLAAGALREDVAMDKVQRIMAVRAFKSALGRFHGEYPEYSATASFQADEDIAREVWLESVESVFDNPKFTRELFETEAPDAAYLTLCKVCCKSLTATVRG